MLWTPSFSRPGRPAPERARPDGRRAKSNNGRSGHVPLPLHGPHPGCLGTSTSGEAPVLLSFLTVPRRYVYILPRSPLPHGLSPERRYIRAPPGPPTSETPS